MCLLVSLLIVNFPIGTFRWSHVTMSMFEIMKRNCSSFPLFFLNNNEIITKDIAMKKPSVLLLCPCREVYFQGKSLLILQCACNNHSNTPPLYYFFFISTFGVEEIIFYAMCFLSSCKIIMCKEALVMRDLISLFFSLFSFRKLTTHYNDSI